MAKTSTLFQLKETDMPGQLFTRYFLTDGIKATAEWQAAFAQPNALATFRDGIRQCPISK